MIHQSSTYILHIVLRRVKLNCTRYALANEMHLPRLITIVDRPKKEAGHTLVITLD
jgi:hypothetical protein